MRAKVVMKLLDVERTILSKYVKKGKIKTKVIHKGTKKLDKNGRYIVCGASYDYDADSVYALAREMGKQIESGLDSKGRKKQVKASHREEVINALKGSKLQKLIGDYIKIGNISLAGALSNLDEEEAKTKINSVAGQKLLAQRLMEDMEEEDVELVMIEQFKKLGFSAKNDADKMKAMEKLNEIAVRRGMLGKEVRVRLVDLGDKSLKIYTQAEFDERLTDEVKRVVDKIKK